MNKKFDIQKSYIHKNNVRSSQDYMTYEILYRPKILTAVTSWQANLSTVTFLTAVNSYGSLSSSLDSNKTIL